MSVNNRRLGVIWASTIADSAFHVVAIAIKSAGDEITHHGAMAEYDASCWFCNPEVRTDPPPGGWVLSNGAWQAGHAPAGYGPVGTVILESRRHVLDQAGFDPDESATYAPVTGLLVDAIRQVTGCDRVYQWATMDAVPHFHLWLIPWSRDDALRGPRFLVDRLVTRDGCDAESAESNTLALRTSLRHATV